MQVSWLLYVCTKQNATLGPHFTNRIPCNGCTRCVRRLSYVDVCSALALVIKWPGDDLEDLLRDCVWPQRMQTD